MFLYAFEIDVHSTYRHFHCCSFNNDIIWNQRNNRIKVMCKKFWPIQLQPLGQFKRTCNCIQILKELFSIHGFMITFPRLLHHILSHSSPSFDDNFAFFFCRSYIFRNAEQNHKELSWTGKKLVDIINSSELIKVEGLESRLLQSHCRLKVTVNLC